MDSNSEPQAVLPGPSGPALGSQPECVLVVGDWFVDEHWVFGVHRSSSSSRTGQAHLRALHRPRSNVQAFCGAGRSAFFLHQLYRNDQGAPLRQVVGLGFWHGADTGALRSLFDPRAHPQTLYRLTLPALAQPNGIELINMNDALNSKLTREERDKREYTTRIIRRYRPAERDQVIYERLDWERVTGSVTWNESTLEALAGLLSSGVRGHKVCAVVVKDLVKGAVTLEIVKWLVARPELSGARWYVSSKRWQPGWLGDLKHVDLRVLMVPQVSAQEAVRRKELSCWIAKSGRPSREAVALIDGLARESGARSVVLLPEGFSALVYLPAANQCVVQPLRAPERIAVDMGGASIIFPAIVACSEHAADSLQPQERLSLALRATYEWVHAEGERVLNPLKWEPDPLNWAWTDTLTKLRNLVRGQATANGWKLPSFGIVRELSWTQEEDAWKDALKDVGIVARRQDKGGELQLWRAMSEVDGYVCCVETTRKRLRELVHGIQAFAKAPRHHASSMLLASPGTGKTFLAKQLARAADLRFVPFNITQMRSKGDILACFDTIAATQAENPEKRLLVFVDEINAELDGGAVYGAFLTPLEEGSYVRSGRAFSIHASAWVFAGTQHPAHVEPDDTPEKQSKGSDFVSRLTLGVVDLGKDRSRQQDHRNVTEMKEADRAVALRALEHVYLGASLLKAEFSDVRQVSELVLRAFWELPLAARVRDVKHFVRRFKDIQYGRVTARNVPDGWPSDDEGEVASRWKGWVDSRKYSDKPDVDIIDTPDLGEA